MMNDEVKRQTPLTERLLDLVADLQGTEYTNVKSRMLRLLEYLTDEEQDVIYWTMEMEPGT